MVVLVGQMLDLHQRLNSAKTSQEKEVLTRRIQTTDHQLDQLVYELYGLTEEEIQLVEAGSA